MTWRGASARLVEGKDSTYKMFWVVNDKGMGGVRILLVEKLVEAIFDVKHVSDRIMLIKLVVGKSVMTVLLVNAPQAGLNDTVKDLFYKICNGHRPKLLLLRSYLFVGISMITLKRMQMGMREFILVEDLEDVIWRVREFLNLLSPTTYLFQIHFS